ncbi:TPA: conjugal transfer protein TraF [Salmonella enterica subsp. enterica serovar Denver]|nr:conjugal transfer protein TraF [Salmonella enterica subsp. enterica serovar Denver]ECD5430151.1 conjugal transfer protein TraF [Salmonella enterica subsp. enterica serovar Denver]HCM3794254.1 conjugal transfer protein TraF [Salmonella enterica subsp. enterica serovar Denver]
MKIKLRQYSLVSFLVFTALTGASHAATTYMEARNDAMGGTGVASSHYGAAAFANPALMTRFSGADDFSLILPAVGVQVSDPDHLQNGVDDVKDAWERYDSGMSAGAAADLQRQLLKFKNTHVNAQAGVGVVATVPNSVVPFALMVKSWGTASVDGRVSDHDLQYLEDVATGKIIPTDADRDALTSRAYGRAAVVSDVGIAMAREFETEGVRYSLGVTPKYQRVDLFNYNVTVQNYDSHDFRSSDYRNTSTGFNADIGFATDLNSHWTLGLVAQNIVPRSIDTKAVNGLKETFKIRPQVTAGASWHNALVTTALDVDLTPASGFTSDKKRQFASLGAEFNAWKWAQLRAGYRQNMSSSEGSAFTAGIGISPFDVVHLDLTGLAGTDRTYGAVAQLSVTF